MNKLVKLIAILAFSFNVTAASAASRVWISEFGTLGTTPAAPAQIAPLPSLTNQSTLDLTAGGGAAQTSAAFGAQTKFIRVVCEVQCAVKGGGTATTSDTLLGALSPEYFGVQAGATISVIAAP